MTSMVIMLNEAICYIPAL